MAANKNVCVDAAIDQKYQNWKVFFIERRAKNGTFGTGFSDGKDASTTSFGNSLIDKGFIQSPARHFMKVSKQFPMTA